jgi:hypothetical protein
MVTATECFIADALAVGFLLPFLRRLLFAATARATM